MGMVAASDRVFRRLTGRLEAVEEGGVVAAEGGLVLILSFLALNDSRDPSRGGWSRQKIAMSAVDRHSSAGARGPDRPKNLSSFPFDLEIAVLSGSFDQKRQEWQLVLVFSLAYGGNRYG